MGRKRTAAACALLLVACGGRGEGPGAEAGADLAPDRAPDDARGTATYERVVHDWLEETPAWEVRRARAGAPPERVELCPARGPHAGGVERLALSLAPPAEVALTVPSGADGGLGWPCRLEALVGLGHEPWGEERGPVPEALANARVRFRLAVDGEVRSEVFLSVPPRAPAETAWVPLVGHGGPPVEVVSGDVVTLCTALVGLDGAELADAPPVAAGVSRLWLSAVRERAVRAASASAPNVVLIVMDTQRVDRLSAYGYDRPTSPNLERLATRGVLFERAYATASWTWPATASILTGLEPEQHGVRDQDSTRLASRLDTLAERMQDRGCATAGFSGNPLIGSGRNFDQGFDRFEGVPTIMRKSDVVVPPALAWMREHADERFFLYLHLVDPHDPHEPRAEDAELLVDVGRPGNFPDQGFLRHSLELRKRGAWTPEGERKPRFEVPEHHFAYVDRMYDACVRTGDFWVGRVLDELEALELADETLVVYTSDHGEELLDHGQLEHGHTIFTELVHVPWVMAGPGVPEGARVREPLSNARLPWTVLHAHGEVAAGPDGFVCLDGWQHLPWRTPPTGPVHYATEHGWWKRVRHTPIRGLLADGWSLQWAPEAEPWEGEQPFEIGDLRLFHVAADPREQRDLARVEPERALELARALREHGAALERQAAASGAVPARPASGAQMLETLRELGYVGDEDE